MDRQLKLRGYSMGTNYYIAFKPCICCGRSEEDYHIGKSSCGWCFSLHVEPYARINNLDDVIDLMDRGTITNENGRVLSKEEMLSIITERKGRSDDLSPEEFEEFCRENRCESGPNNLMRSKVDGSHCIGHGEGTWDLISGEFS